MTQQPKGFHSLFFIRLFFMFGSEVIQSLLVLYCIKSLGFTDNQAYSLFAAYAALVLGAPLLGGYLGSTILGYRSTLILGSYLVLISLFALACPGRLYFYLGLSCFIVGAGCMSSNLMCLLGLLYEENDIQRDNGFNLLYVAENIGSFVAIAASGTLAEFLGFQMAFLIGGIIMLFTPIFYFFGRKHFIRVEEKNLKLPTAHADTQSTNKINILMANKAKIFGYALIALTLPISIVLLQYPTICNILLFGLGVLSCALIIMYIVKYEGKTRRNLCLFLGLLIISIPFWAIHNLMPSALTLFTDRNIDRIIFGWEIPTASVMSLNPLTIILFGPILGFIWTFLNRHGKNISTYAKFAIGFIFLGIGYLILLPGIHMANTNGMIAFIWIILTYFFQTVGELFVGPVGYAMVGTLVPEEMNGIMMGILQLTSGIASIFSGYLASLTAVHDEKVSPIITNVTYHHTFLKFGLTCIIISFILFGIYPFIKKYWDIQ